MPVQRTVHGHVREDGSFAVLARILGLDDAAVTQADISGSDIEGRCFRMTENRGKDELDTPVETWSKTDIAKTAVIFDVLQTGSGWPADEATGYNLRVVVPATAMPLGEERYQVEFKLTMGDLDADGNNATVFVVVGVWAEEVATS